MLWGSVLVPGSLLCSLHALCGEGVEQQPGDQGLSVWADLPRGPGCSAGSCTGCALASGAHCHKKCRDW